MPKPMLLALTLTVVLVAAYWTFAINYKTQTQFRPKNEIDTAINQAKHVYNQRKMEGEDFSRGPCLSDALMPGWVLDIAHNPRQPIDDLAQNQCPAYIEGRVQHFVELDIGGNLIRAK